AADVLLKEALDQIGDGGGAAFGLDIGERISAGVNLALEFACLLAGAHYRPVWEGAHRVRRPPAAPRAGTEDEAAVAGRGDANSQAGHLCVPGDDLADYGRRQALDLGVG